MPVITSTKRPSLYLRIESRPFALTERDVGMLEHARRLRFARSSHLVMLDGGSEQQALRRLRGLYDHGYLDRVSLHKRRVMGEGSERVIYALAQDGARVLAARSGVPLARRDWERKNIEATQLFVEHSLSVADVIVPLWAAVQRVPGMRLALPEDLLQELPDATLRTQRPWLFRVPVTVNGRETQIGVEPDAVLRLTYPDGKRRHLLVEADRSTMPVRRRGLRISSIYRKLLGYYAGRSGVIQERYGFPGFEVVIVTSSKARVENIIEAAADACEGRGWKKLLVTTFDALARDPLNAEWINGGGEKVRLCAVDGR